MSPGTAVMVLANSKTLNFILTPPAQIPLSTRPTLFTPSHRLCLITVMHRTIHLTIQAHQNNLILPQLQKANQSKRTLHPKLRLLAETIQILTAHVLKLKIPPPLKQLKPNPPLSKMNSQS